MGAETNVYILVESIWPTKKKHKTENCMTWTYHLLSSDPFFLPVTQDLVHHWISRCPPAPPALRLFPPDTWDTLSLLQISAPYCLHSAHQTRDCEMYNRYEKNGSISQLLSSLCPPFNPKHGPERQDRNNGSKLFSVQTAAKEWLIMPFLSCSQPSFTRY